MEGISCQCQMELKDFRLHQKRTIKDTIAVFDAGFDGLGSTIRRRQRMGSVFIFEPREKGHANKFVDLGIMDHWKCFNQCIAFV